MYAMIKRDENVIYNVNEYVCDSVNDLDPVYRGVRPLF